MKILRASALLGFVVCLVPQPLQATELPRQSACGQYLVALAGDWPPPNSLHDILHSPPTDEELFGQLNFLPDGAQLLIPHLLVVTALESKSRLGWKEALLYIEIQILGEEGPQVEAALNVLDNILIENSQMVPPVWRFDLLFLNDALEDINPNILKNVNIYGEILEAMDEVRAESGELNL